MATRTRWAFSCRQRRMQMAAEAERKKGNVKQLAPGASFKTKVVFGGLTATEAKDAAAVIAKIRG